MAEEPDDRFKAIIVNMILDSQPEAALEALSRRYRVDTPRLGVGVFKRHSKGVRAVYVWPPSTRLIAAISSAGLTGFIRKS